MADIKAQLLGYQAELQYATTYKKGDERIAAIEDAIKALEGPARAEVARLRTAGDGHQALNQDDLAALRRREADDLEALLPAKEAPAEEAEDTPVADSGGTPAPADDTGAEAGDDPADDTTAEPAAPTRASRAKPTATGKGN